MVVVGPGGVRLDYRGSDSGFRRCKASIRLPECPQIVCAIDSPCPPPVCDPEALGEAALACPGGNGVSAVSRSAPPTGRRRKRR